MTDRDTLIQEVKRLRRGRGVTAVKLEHCPVLLGALSATTGADALPALTAAVEELADSVEARALRAALAIGYRAPGTLTERRIAFAAEVDRGVDAVQDYEDTAIVELAVRLVRDVAQVLILTEADALSAVHKIVQSLAQALETPVSGGPWSSTPLPLEREPQLRQAYTTWVTHELSRQHLTFSKRKIERLTGTFVERVVAEGRQKFALGWTTGLWQAALYIRAFDKELDDLDRQRYHEVTAAIAAMSPYPFPITPAPAVAPAASVDSQEETDRD